MSTGRNGERSRTAVGGATVIRRAGSPRGVGEPAAVTREPDARTKPIRRHGSRPPDPIRRGVSPVPCRPARVVSARSDPAGSRSVPDPIRRHWSRGRASGVGPTGPPTRGRHCTVTVCRQSVEPAPYRTPVRLLTLSNTCATSYTCSMGSRESGSNHPAILNGLRHSAPAIKYQGGRFQSEICRHRNFPRAAARPAAGQSRIRVDPPGINSSNCFTLHQLLNIKLTSFNLKLAHGLPLVYGCPNI